jgi:two-component system nitrate/nitrite response regulator NarL
MAFALRAAEPIPMRDRSGKSKTTVAICDTCPAAAAGLAGWLDAAAEFECFWISNILPVSFASLGVPDVLVLDKALGMSRVQNWLSANTAFLPSVVVWSVSTTEAEALRLMALGVKGIVRRSDPPARILECLRRVAEGRTWFEDVSVSPPQPRVAVSLTERERQVIGLLRHGYKNREIARELGIAAGTVKVHLRHVFEKTGVRGRFGIAVREFELGAGAADGVCGDGPETLRSA